MRKKLISKVFTSAIFLLILLNFFIWREIITDSPYLEVVFFNVGQGDSIFIETPKNLQVLIDGGPSAKIVLEKLSKEIPFWDRSIDLVVLTHPDFDHLNGLNWVLESYEVKNILWSGVEEKTSAFNFWKENVEGEVRKGAKEIMAEKGKLLTLGDVSLTVFYPEKSMKGEVLEENTNETSVVTKLNYGNIDFLFPGDITKEIETNLLNLELPLNSDVLKVAHHGSKSSSSYYFLKEVSPKLAVISAGKDNSYGHPHSEVLNRIKYFGINSLITAEKGDIKILSDGDNFNALIGF